MTGIPEKEFSRKSFLKGGGALIVGLSLAGRVAGREGGARAIDPFASPGPADPNSVDSFLSIHADNTASLNSGRIKLGQDSTTGLMMIAAEELDMDFSQFRHIEFDTGGADPSPNTGQHRRLHVDLAGWPARPPRGGRGEAGAARAGVDEPRRPGREPDGGQGRRLRRRQDRHLRPARRRQADERQVRDDDAEHRRRARRSPEPVQAGRDRPRPRTTTSRRSSTGVHTYAANVRVPGMLHGRVVRPRGQGAYGDGTNPVPLTVDDELDQAHPGRADRARRQLPRRSSRRRSTTRSRPPRTLKVQVVGSAADRPAVGNLWLGMRQRDSAGQAPARIAAQGPTTPGLPGQLASVDAAMASAAKTYGGTFKYHYQMHAPIGPNVSVADVTTNSAIIYGHVKNGYGVTRSQVAAALNTAAQRSGSNRLRPEPRPRRLLRGLELVRRRRAATSTTTSARRSARSRSASRSGSSGCAGTSTAGTTTARPRSGTSRAASTPTASSSPGTPRASAWRRTRRRRRSCRSASRCRQPGAGPADTTYSGTQYDIPNRRIIGKTVNVLNGYFKTSTLRAPNAPQTVFANEQVIDQLAYLAGQDPYQFRLNNISTAPLGTGVGTQTANASPASGSGATRSSPSRRRPTGSRGSRTR